MATLATDERSMQAVAELHCADADARVTNALLLVVNSIGIPVLAREYGEVHAPPSAAVGILSAIHHASTKDSGASLHLLESAHRTVAYHTTPEHELLLVFASDKQLHERSVLASHRDGGTSRMLATIGTALSVLLGSQAFADLDASKQRLALSKHTDTIDYIVKNFRRDIRLLLGRPLQGLNCDYTTFEHTESSRLQLTLHLQRGLVVADHGAQLIESDGSVPDALELVVLSIWSECLAARGVENACEVVKLGGSSKRGGVLSTLVLEGSESLSDHSARVSIFHHDTQEPEEVR